MDSINNRPSRLLTIAVRLASLIGMSTDKSASNTQTRHSPGRNTSSETTSAKVTKPDASTTDAPTTPWFEEVPIPALLRHARTTYGAAMRKALAEAGYDDVPKNGLYVIGGMALETGPVPLAQMIEELGISKQSASQLVDTLVTRGYLQRTEDPDDRRKLTITLTERGRDAAAKQSGARKKIDATLIACVGEEDVRRTRRTLAVLIDIGHHSKEDGQDE